MKRDSKSSPVEKLMRHSSLNWVTSLNTGPVVFFTLQEQNIKTRTMQLVHHGRRRPGLEPYEGE